MFIEERSNNLEAARRCDEHARSTPTADSWQSFHLPKPAESPVCPSQAQARMWRSRRPQRTAINEMEQGTTDRLAGQRGIQWESHDNHASLRQDQGGGARRNGENNESQNCEETSNVRTKQAAAWNRTSSVIIVARTLCK